MVIRRYSRVSTQEQARDSESLNRQNWQLDRAIERLGYDPLQAIQYEDKQSGKDDDRINFQRMLADLQPGDIVVILRTDRIARDVSMNARLADMFQANNIKLYLDRKQKFINWQDPGDWKEFINQGVDAEYESRELSRRITDGFDYLQEKGLVLARVPWGYRRTDDRRYARIVELIPAMRWIIDTIKQTENLQQTVRLFNQRYAGSKQWTPNGLRRWLHNPVLRGHSPYGRSASGDHYAKIIFYTHKPDPSKPEDQKPDESVLSEEEYAVIKAVFQDNKALWGKNQRRDLWTPLGGLLICQKCGIKMTPVTGSSGESPRRYYVCRQRNHNYVNQQCEMRHALRVEAAEAIVVDYLIQKAPEIAVLASEPLSEEESGELLDLRHQLAQLEKVGNNPAIVRACQDLKQQIAQRQSEGRMAGTVYAEKAELLMALSDPRYWSSLSASEKRMVFRSLIKRVLVWGEPVSLGRLSRAGNPVHQVQWHLEVELNFEHPSNV